MIWMVLGRVLLFLLPFGIYALYIQLLRKDEDAQRPAPWTTLFIAGLTLVALSFVVLGLSDRPHETGQYVPPQNVGGKVVPGHFQPDK